MKELNENTRKSIISLIMACLVGVIIFITTIGSLILFFKVDEKPFEFSKVDSEEIIEEQNDSIAKTHKTIVLEGGYSDVDLLAALIKLEGQEQITLEQAKRIGIIALNRVHVKYYPDTVFDVIFDGKEWFGCSYDEGNFCDILTTNSFKHYQEIAQELIIASQEKSDWENYCEELKLTTTTCHFSIEQFDTVMKSLDEYELEDYAKSKFGMLHSENISLVVINCNNNTIETYYDMFKEVEMQIEIIPKTN